VRRKILSLIGTYVVDIQHVGSTAIPGIPAKPILDVIVLLRHRRLVPRAARILCAEGYVDHHRHGLVRDRWWLTRGQFVRTQHVSLTWPGGTTWDYYIRFRDWLRTHSKDARRYAKLKRSLAKRYHSDVASYTGGKSAFVVSILKRSGPRR
jgi:GrpB-like predicted nucleotidyltransferase (UPF0157 family)